MDYQSSESEEGRQRWVGDPGLGKERIRGPHKRDLAIKEMATAESMHYVSI